MNDHWVTVVAVSCVRVVRCSRCLFLRKGMGVQKLFTCPIVRVPFLCLRTTMEAHVPHTIKFSSIHQSLHDVQRTLAFPAACSNHSRSMRREQGLAWPQGSFARQQE